MIREFTLEQGLDELGFEEEFTNDSFLILPDAHTEHLDADGLPAVGTQIMPGMIMIAKFGTTKSYARSKLPSDLEQWSHSKQELIEKYKHMFYDACLYAPPGVTGKVVAAWLEPCNARSRAVVRIQLDH